MTEATVRAELDALQALVVEATPALLRDGTWLLPLLEHALAPYAAATDLAALAQAHPGLDQEGIAEARIGRAQRAASIGGGLSAASYASVVVASLATGGAATAVALPVAVAAFAGDLYYASRVQLCLTWDLAVLYGRRFDLADAADTLTLVRIAFGVEEDQAFATTAGRFAPEASRFTSRTLTTAARLAARRGLPAVGRHVVARSLARYALPLVGVPLCAAVNHFTTGAVGRQAQRLLRGVADARATARSLADQAADPTLLVQAVLLLIHADDRVRAAEHALLHTLSALYVGHPLPDPAVTPAEPELLERIGAAPADLRALLYEAALEAAALDGSLHSAENSLLQRLAEACGVPFDPRAVTAIVTRRRGD